MTNSVTIHRLSPEAYQQLAKGFGTIHVSHQTTELQAGFQLGVQAVLTLIREGFTVERPTTPAG